MRGVERAVWPDAVGLLCGFALDAALGDPRRWHPVAGFGRANRVQAEARCAAD